MTPSGPSVGYLLLMNWLRALCSPAHLITTVTSECSVCSSASFHILSPFFCVLLSALVFMFHIPLTCCSILKSYKLHDSCKSFFCQSFSSASLCLFSLHTPTNDPFHPFSWSLFPPFLNHSSHILPSSVRGQMWWMHLRLKQIPDSVFSATIIFPPLMFCTLTATLHHILFSPLRVASFSSSR